VSLLKKFFVIFLVIILLFIVSGIYTRVFSEPKAASGVKKVNVRVPVDADGYTIEQKNVARRLIEDNKPGSIKHLYVISAYSGQVLIYSTVNGKVTSSGKRLSPYTITEGGEYIPGDPFPVNIGGETRYTTEVLQDDGTYGRSIPYLFWWDTKGVYHQHYITGGQMVHISNQSLAVKSIVINMELTKKNSEE